MFVHVADAVDRGHNKIMIRTVDTDVVVIAVSCIQKLPQLSELWVHMGSGKRHSYVPCHTIAAALGSEKAKVLPLFHAFTGCDTVSCFNGRGKKTAFEAWSAYPQATTGFQLLLDEKIQEADPIIQKYVVTMYDRSSQCATVNECRKHLFTKKDRPLEKIPPTQSALHQHTLRAVYQGFHIWSHALEPLQDLPDPASWGWRKSGTKWSPYWTDKPEVAEACRDLTRCRCKAGCRQRCKCKKIELKCTELCLCEGKCI